MTYTTREATIDDAPLIARFNRAMALETEGKTLDPATLAAGVRRVLVEPGHGRYLVAAAADGQVVASLMITYEWSDWRDGQVWWVQSVYVTPEHRRRGVFKRMYADVVRLGRQTGGVCGYRLYVERDNAAAQRAYEKLGMQAAPYLIYEAMPDA